MEDKRLVFVKAMDEAMASRPVRAKRMRRMGVPDMVP